MLLSVIGDKNYIGPKFSRLVKKTQNGQHGKTKQAKLIGVTSKHGVRLDKKMRAQWSIRERIRIRIQMAGMLALMFNKNMAKIVHPLYTQQ